MSTDKALNIASIAVGSVAAVAGTVMMAKAFTSNGQSTALVLQGPLDLNTVFIDDGSFSTRSSETLPLRGGLPPRSE